jgi:hypothetical protein
MSTPPPLEVPVGHWNAWNSAVAIHDDCDWPGALWIRATSFAWATGLIDVSARIATIAFLFICLPSLF